MTRSSPSSLGQVLGAVNLDDDDDGAPLPSANQDVQHFLRFMPPLIQELSSKGVDMTLDMRTGEILIKGFYKNGDMRVLTTEDASVLTTVDRYNKSASLTSFEDLARLNYQWWVRSNTKQNYLTPQSPFLEEFRRLGLVKRHVMYMPNEET